MNTAQNAFLTDKELVALGFSKIGTNVKISRRATFYNPQNVIVGDNSRIDDHVVISAGSQVSIGRYVHISLGVAILGKGEVVIEDFVSISVRTSIFSSNDDYSGAFMTNPTVPAHLTKITHEPVYIRRHVVIGAHSIVLPGTHLGHTSAFGALSLMKGKFAPYGIYAGVPAVKIKDRLDYCEKLAKEIF